MQNFKRLLVGRFGTKIHFLNLESLMGGLLQNNNHKTKIILLQNSRHMSEVHRENAVRFGQALPGYLITAHHLYACLL